MFVVNSRELFFELKGVEYHGKSGVTEVEEFGAYFAEEFGGQFIHEIPVTGVGSCNNLWI
ncbi:MAG: hypothetical protein ACLFPF_03550 [Halanaerobiales bacterium]